MSGYGGFIPIDYKIATGAVNSLISNILPPYNRLKVLIRISGYGGNAIAQLQFNSDTGTTAYAYRVSNNFAAATTGVAGVANGIKVAQTQTTNPRPLIEFTISNIAGRAHGMIYQASDLSEAAATAPDIVLGSGLWATTGQITQITLDGGGQTLLAGTDMAIYGLPELG